MPIALVTGASGGLGREAAKCLLIAGYDVIAHYNSASEKDLMRHLQRYEGRVFSIKADLSSKDDIRLMATRIGDKYGGINVVINSAGITRDRLLINCSQEDWDNVIGVNLSGVFYVIQAILPLLINSRDGHVVNVSSISGIKGVAGQCAYSASKAALLGLTYALAKELSGFHVRVNAIMPGYMETEMGLANPQALMKAQGQSLLNCLSSVQETASFICWLVKTQRQTGQVFTLDSRVL
ncbi:MAG: SDR family NAD(P)-dependent oxidoreductase [Nitrospirae bacterium]|nr:SDR family NAD(P)-dependent oxidoreductase [Nitrospirota bacterium]